MKFIAAILALLIFSPSGVAQTTIKNPSDSATEQELVRIAQGLLDATEMLDRRENNDLVWKRVK